MDETLDMYFVAFGSHEQLQAKVEEAIKLGYWPMGGVTVVIPPSSGALLFAQAMVLTNPNNDGE